MILREAPSEYRMTPESSQIKGIELEGYNFLTRCRYLLGNESFQHFVDRVPRNLRTRRYRRQREQAPSIREYQIHFLTSAEALPEQMCQDVLYVRDPSLPLLGTNYLHIQTSALLQPYGENEDTLLKVTYSLPAEPQERKIDFFEQQHETIETYLHELIPFSRGRLRRLFPLYEEPQGNLFSQSAEDYSRFLEKADRKVHYPPSFGFPSLATPYSNLYILGPDQLGWLGLEGRLHGAMKAVDLIWAKESKLRRFH